MNFTNFLTESFNNPVEFDLTDDTKMPREIYAIFKINGTDYGCSLVQTKYDRVYSLEAYRIVTKKKRFWSYKSVADMRPFLATIIKFLESVYPFIKQKMDGIIIDLPNGADSEKYVKFLELIINKFYVKTYRAIPIVKKTDKAGNYLLVTKKVIKPETLFKTAAFHKHFDFTGIPDAEAFDTIKEPFKIIKPTVNMTIDPRYVFKSIVLDDMTPETLSVFDAEPETDIEETEFDLTHITKNASKEAITIADFYAPTEPKQKMFEEKDIVWTTAFTAKPDACNPIFYMYRKLYGNYIVTDILDVAVRVHLRYNDPSYEYYHESEVKKYKLAMDYLNKGDLENAHKYLSPILETVHSVNNEVRWIIDFAPDEIKKFLTENDLTLDRIDFWGDSYKKMPAEDILKYFNLAEYYFNLVKSFYPEVNKEYTSTSLYSKYEETFDMEWIDKVKFSKENPAHVSDKLTKIKVSSIKTPEMKAPENSPFAYSNDDVYSPENYLGLVDAPYLGDGKDNIRSTNNPDGLAYLKKKYLSEMPVVGDFLHRIDTFYGVKNGFKYPNMQGGKPEKPNSYSSLEDEKKYDKKMKEYNKKLGIDKDLKKNMQVFREYTGNYSGIYNSMFRDSIELGRHPMNTNSGDNYVKIRDAIFWAFENAPVLPEPIWVYRNFSFDGIRNKNPGDLLIDPGFMSTSVRSDMSYGSNKGRLKIFLPVGAKIIPMLDSSENAGEDEIILFPFSTLKIMKKFQTDNKTSFICHYTGNGAKAYFDYTGQFDKAPHKFDLRESKKAHITLPDYETESAKKWTAPFVSGDTMKRLEKMIREGFGNMEKEE